MAVELLYYSNKDDKKRNKEIADAMAATIKEFESIDLVSSITGKVEGTLTKRDEINPGWNGIEIILDEFLSEAVFEKPRVIKDIVFGTIIDHKHEDAEIEAIDHILL